jgi:hypothetical protein
LASLYWRLPTSPAALCCVQSLHIFGAAKLLMKKVFTWFRDCQAAASNHVALALPAKILTDVNTQIATSMNGRVITQVILRLRLRFILTSVVGTNSEQSDEIHLWIIISFSFCLRRVKSSTLEGSNFRPFA